MAEVQTISEPTCFAAASDNARLYEPLVPRSFSSTSMPYAALKASTSGADCFESVEV